jgi:hypothetical protein
MLELLFFCAYFSMCVVALVRAEILSSRRQACMSAARARRLLPDSRDCFIEHCGVPWFSSQCMCTRCRSQHLLAWNRGIR